VGPRRALLRWFAVLVSSLAVGLVVTPATTAHATPGTQVTIHVSHGIVFGRTASLSGRVRSDGALVPGAKVVLFKRQAGVATWTRFATTHTGSSGSYLVTTHPSRNVEYFAWAPGSPHQPPDTSVAARTLVAPRVTVRASPAIVPAGHDVQLMIDVRPAHPGMTVTVQSWTGSAWQSMQSSLLSARSTAVATVTLAAAGNYRLRVVTPAHDDHAAGSGAAAATAVSWSDDFPRPGVR
jgi:hypothetical protein